ncbi:hypothetical protein FA15DRAFT_679808 [Coprinopsis marcescibilis]|uniref:Tc1-like transposase DDE domain-containing protein n=1 Tax=Coprinopsis marcescibilis TaxID=230819 RepID=A0A5C3KZK2_COPMA|nr:hypothetical protein FA15DRAFT_679808 [Coprinopsis marcescibilis]
MEQLIRERGLWQDSNGLRFECSGFKCHEGATNCCCRRVMYTQPDFVAQKSQLEEFVESRGHLCDFYPKYHCELNFIEQYWGMAKAQYRNSPRTNNQDEMGRLMLICLDKIDRLLMFLLDTCVYNSLLGSQNRGARFISAYDLGLSGAEAAWANKRYHRHRTLPPIMLAEVRRQMAESIAPLD